MSRHGSMARSVRRPVLIWSILVVAVALEWQHEARAADPVEGRKIYTSQCQNCHGENGVGQIPGTPDFSRGQALFKPDMTLVQTIKEGKGMMPAYRGLLTDEELLDVVAFLRTLR